MSGTPSLRQQLAAASSDTDRSFGSTPVGQDALPCAPPDRLVLEWPEALSEHLPESLRIRLVLGKRVTDLAWSAGSVDGDLRRFTFEDVRPGSLCTLFAVTSARVLRLWQNQRANDPDDPPTFEHWLEELVRKQEVSAQIVDLGPMSRD